MKKVFLRGALGAVTALLLSVELVSPALLSLSAQGETAEPPASKERVWEFDSEEDMKDFMSEFTYSKYQGAPAGLEGKTVADAAVSDRWEIKNGALCVKDTSTVAPSEGGNRNIAALTIRNRQFRNFDLKVTLRKPGKMAFVSFRESLPGEVLPEGDSYTWGQQSNGVKHGTVWVNDGGRACLYASGKKADTQDGTEKTPLAGNSLHVLRVKVVGNQCELYVDDNPTPVLTNTFEADAPSEGFISIALGNYHGSIERLAITRLDEDGNPTDYEDTSTKWWEFDSEEDMKDFMSEFTYSKYQGAPAGLEGKTVADAAVSDRWEIKNGALCVKDTSTVAPSEGGNRNIAALTIRNRQFRNFDLKVTLRKPGKMAFVSFRESLPGEVLPEGDSYTWGQQSNGAKHGTVWVDDSGRACLYASGECTDTQDGTEKTPLAGDSLHVLRVKVVGNQCELYVDDNPTPVLEKTFGADAPSEGFVSIALGNYHGSIERLAITRLDEVGNPTDYMPEPPLPRATGVTNPETMTVALGTTLEELNLPTAVTVTLDNGTTANCPVLWLSGGYNADVDDIYTMQGLLQNTGAFDNGANITVSIQIEVKDEYDTESTTKIKFKDINDLDNFSSYYAERVTESKEQEFKAAPFGDHWTLNNQTITRKNDGTFQDNESDYQNKIAVLFYNKRTYKNFELELTYRQGGDSWKWAMVGFGAKSADGTFALKEGGGTVAYVEMEGRRNFWGNLLTQTDHYQVRERDTGLLAGYNRNAAHRMKLVVIGNKATMYIDDYTEIWTTTLKDYEGGYIYLAAGKNSASFSNITITDLDHYDHTVMSVSPVADQVIERAKGESLCLPETVRVVASDSSRLRGQKGYDVPVVWDCKDVDFDKAGTYTLTGRLQLDGTSFKNPQEETVSLTFENRIDYNPETTVKFYFDNMKSVEKLHFAYAENALDGMQPAEAAQHWLCSGTLRRKYENFTSASTPYDRSNDYLKVAAATYTGHVFHNFELHVDYTQGIDSYYWAMIGFGQTELNQFAFTRDEDDNITMNPNGGLYAYVEREGRSVYWGNADSADNDEVGRIRPRISNLKDYIGREPHHMRLVMLNGIVTMYIDDQEINLKARVPSQAQTGYISLISVNNDSQYDNLSITPLDFEGNPVPLSEAHRYLSGGAGQEDAGTWQPDEEWGHINNAVDKKDPDPTEPTDPGPETGERYGWTYALLPVAVCTGVLLALKRRGRLKQRSV